ncbi:efflux RND transporter periplasmic adaptor subunit [Neorhizobium sp. NCHU2750]|uniref:efflux RND transporter periplasmic adaptor subunit n=1 Tax=Neorhizobium sp. NCHU2750 TaxID=1825976 RepID=UPI000E71607F|nr:MexE family multidrug efflux RND transporter periplasmic adaptor subunit [Neorhizobium sp. NCHU2750]
MQLNLAKPSSHGMHLARCVQYTLLLYTLLVMTACSGQQRSEGATPPPRSVAVVQPQTASVMRYLNATGTTKALDSVDLTARVTGYLRSIDYEDGKAVKKGQRLFLIEPDQYEAQEQQAQASVEQAKASLDNAQVQLDRQQELLRSSTTTQASVDNARSSRDTSKAQLDSAAASLKQAQINLAYTSVTAPFDGFVTEHQADVGALVGSGGPTVLATIVRLDPIHVSFAISDTDMLQIRRQVRERGLTAKDIRNITVEAATNIDTDFPYKGRIDYVSPQTDAGSGTLAVRAIFDNKNRELLPNLFVRLRIPMGTVDDAVLVPPSAIGTDQQGRFVLAVKDDNTVERRSITLLDRSGNLQQVEGSLSAKDRVVANALGGVRAGEKIDPQVAPAAGAGTEGDKQHASATPSN